MLSVHDEPFQFWDMGRRAAARSVGILWIDGLWPEFCRINWESVVVVTCRPSAAVPCKDGPAELCIRASALWKSSLGSKVGSDRANGPFEQRDRPCCDFSRIVVMNPAASGRLAFGLQGSYLVDPASSHMLVSKIKPCMSKYKQLYGETANGSLNQL